MKEAQRAGKRLEEKSVIKSRKGKDVGNGKKYLSLLLVLVMLLINVRGPVVLAGDGDWDAAENEENAENMNMPDAAALFDWMDRQLPATAAEFEKLPREWWDSLLPWEYLMAEAQYRHLLHTNDGTSLDYVDESIEAYIERLQAGASARQLFWGTVFDGVDLELLQMVREEGGTMEDLLAWRASLDLYAGEQAVLTTAWENFGNGRINRKWLDGKDAFCFNEDKKFPNGAVYARVTASEAGFTGRAAYIVEFYGSSGETNSHWWNECQVAVWAVQAGCDTYDQGAAFAAAYCKERGITDAWYVSDYKEIVGKLVEQSRGQSGSCYVYKAVDSANQDIATYTPIWVEPEGKKAEYADITVEAQKSASRTHEVRINTKYAAVTEELLAGIVFEVYENGDFKGTIVTDEEGKGALSWQLEKTAYASCTKTYCSNYDELMNDEKSKVTGYRSREEAEDAARSEAEKDAQKKAEEAAGAACTVSVVEQGAPEGYLLTGDSQQSFVLEGNDSATIAVRNDPWKAKLIIHKVDGDTGESIEADAGFVLYEWNRTGYEISGRYEIIRLEDGTYTVKGDYADAETGYLYYTGANAGRFGLQEIQAPDKYYPDQEIWYFQITEDGHTFYGHNKNPGEYPIGDDTKFANKPYPVPEYAEVTETAEFTAERNRKIIVDRKYAAITGESLEGAVFEVYEEGVLKGSITTDPAGCGELQWTLESTKSSTATCVYCSNYDELESEEKALVTGYITREEARLAASAAAEAEAKKLAEEVVDAECRITVREAETPDGFSFSEDAEQNTVFVGDGCYTFEAENVPWKARLIIDKADGTTGERLPEGAVFVLYEWNGSAYQVSADYDIVCLEDGTYTAVSRFCDGEQGYLYYTQTNEGRFGIREIKAPLGYVADGEMYCFELTADGQILYGRNASAENYEICDDTKFMNRQTRHIFTKTDVLSGALLSGAVLELYEIIGEKADGGYETVLVERWVSDKEERYCFYENENGMFMEFETGEELPKGQTLMTKPGHLVKGLKTGSRYMLREITAPFGYIRNGEDMIFTVEEQGNVVEYDMDNARATGAIQIIKKGEFLTCAEKHHIDADRDFFKTLFAYEIGSVENAVFEVYAAEDIVVPDQTGTLAVYNGTKLKKDALAGVVVTDERGSARLEDLPLGTYYIRETGAGDGDFLRNPEIMVVELAYEGQNVSAVTGSAVEFINERQRVSLVIAKRSSDELGEDRMNTVEVTSENREVCGIAGAVFGLYAAEDIDGFEIEEDTGMVRSRPGALIPADTLIEKISTDGEGVAEFTSGLPCAKYYVKELDPPAGYLASEEIYEIDASYIGQEGEEVLSFFYEFYNKPVTIGVDKIDAADHALLAGASLEVRDTNGNVIDTWISDGTTHRISNLLLDTEYILSETKTVDGYATAEDILFKVTQARSEVDGSLLQEVEVWTLTVRDGHERGPSGIISAPYQYTDGEYSYRPGEGTEAGLVAEWEIIDRILYVEICRNAGAEAVTKALREYLFYEYEFDQVYVTGGKADFFEEKQIREAPTQNNGRYVWVKSPESKVVMENERIKVVISKCDMATGIELPGAMLTVMDGEGNVIETWESTYALHSLERLLPGEYWLVEESVPENSYYSRAEKIKFTVEESGKIQMIEMMNDHIRICVLKSSSEYGQALPGATLAMYYLKPEGGSTPIGFWVSGNEGKMFEKMRPGTYMIVEVEAPEGYEPADPVVFTVDDGYQIHHVNVKNEKIPPTSKPPHTGDKNPLIGYGLLALAGAAASVVLWRRRRK